MAMTHARRDKSSTTRWGLATAVVIGLVCLRPALDVLRDLPVAGALTGTDVLGATMAAAGVWALLTGEVRWPTDAPELKLFAWFVVVATACGLIAGFDAPISSMVGSIIKLVGLVAVMVVAVHVGRIRPQVGLRVLALSALIPCGIAAYQVAAGTGMQPDTYAPQEAQLVRAFGTFSHPNVLGAFSAIMLIIVIAVLSSKLERGAWRLLWALLGLIAAVSILGAYTRAVWLALPIALVASAASVGRRMAMIVLIAASAYVAIALNLGGISSRLAGGSSVSFRTALWDGMLDRLTPETMVVGHGLGQMNAYVLQVSTELGITRVDEVHNDYLRVLFESGIVAALLYFGSLLMLSRRGRRMAASLGAEDHAARVRRAIGKCAVGVVVFVLLVSVSDNLYEDLVLQIPLWFVAGLAIGATVSEPPDTIDSRLRRAAKAP